jgi:hypothetical protein
VGQSSAFVVHVAGDQWTPLRLTLGGRGQVEPRTANHSCCSLGWIEASPHTVGT